jgi:probable glucitol transport protein GutA
MSKGERTLDRLPVGKFFLWKSRDISLAAMNTIILGYLTFFCTNVLGMKPALVGTLLMVSKLFDGFTDLLAGFLIDNTKSKWGKARPYEIAVIGVWGCSIFLFFASPEWSTTVKAVWVFVMYTMVFSVYATILQVSQTPYMIRAFSNNQRIITKVSSLGGIVSMLGGIIVSASFPVFMAKIATSADGWQNLILIYAVPLLVIGILRLVFVKEDPAVDGENGPKVRLKEIIMMLRKNKYCWVYAGIMGLYNIALGFGAGSYFFTYVMGDISKFGLVSISSIALLPVMFIFPTMLNRMSVSNLFALFAAVAAIGYGIVFLGNSSLPLVLIGVVAANLLNLPLGYLGALIIMQLSAYNESIGLPRMEGSSGVVAGFAGKAGSGIGAALCGFLLGKAGFLSSVASKVTQPESAMLMIRLLYSLLPGICALLIAILSFKLNQLEKLVKS